jgi:hypothetical protein
MARRRSTPAPNPVVPKVVWRFADLRASGVVKNHDMLKQLIKEEGFPPGIWLSANVHAWVASEVMAWVANRPVKRPPPPSPQLDVTGRRRRRGRQEAAPQPALAAQPQAVADPAVAG